MIRCCYLAAALVLAGCNPTIYVRDGVTDGDTFYLAPRAFADNDPALQSWVRYSLMRSTCQLEAGGAIPSRASTYDCELKSREHLLDAWVEKRALGTSNGDVYLDTLVAVREAGFLEEYVAHYFGKDDWNVPAALETETFGQWRRTQLRGHRPETRWIGSWGYGHNSSVAAHSGGAD